MTNKEKTIPVAIDTQPMRQAEQQARNLQETVKELKKELTGAFTQTQAEGYFHGVTQSSARLEKELLVLRLNFGKLKSAITDAMAPLGAVFVPMVNQAVWAAIRFVKAMGQVMGALFGGSEANNAMEASTEDAAKAQKTLTGTSGKLKRVLMHFDEINRLGETAGGSGEAEVSTGTVKDQLSPQVQKVVDKIMALLAPLKEIDFSAVIEAFEKLKKAVSAIGKNVFAGLEWAWYHLLVPLAQWTIEDALPAFLDVLTSALGVLNSVIKALQPAAEWLWRHFLEPLAQWTGEQIIAALGWLREKLDKVSQWISENQELVQKIAGAVLAVASAVGLVNGALGNWNILNGVSIGLMDQFGGKMSWLANPILLVSTGIKVLAAAVLLLGTQWDSVKEAAVSAWSKMQATWENASFWFRENVLLPLTGGFKNTVNGIIGFLNGLIEGIVSAVNSVIQALQKLNWKVPDWVPGLGGKEIGFHFSTLRAPKIPYLAQGAVLPANKPFMAVLGDQRHGTNIEAPLSTIQEAVAIVMEDMVKSNLAGHEATVAVLREILEAVLGIEIGDDVIGSAVLRYNRKMAVVKGGAL